MWDLELLKYPLDHRGYLRTSDGTSVQLDQGIFVILELLKYTSFQTFMRIYHKVNNFTKIYFEKLLKVHFEGNKNYNCFKYIIL